MSGVGRGAGPEEAGPAAHAAVPLLVDYLDDVAVRTAARLGDATGVAVTFAVGTAPVTIGASSQLALDVDVLQYQVGDGPCLQALRSDETLYVPDLGADQRWRDYGPRAAALGAASCVSVPVRVEGRPQAVLKVYAGRVDGLDAEQRATAARTAVDISGGVALALHLSRQARELDDRAAAMDRRRTIDLALGILMERNGTGADAAFDLLRHYSQHFNVRLHAAAAEVVGDRDSTPSAVRAPFAADRGR